MFPSEHKLQKVAKVAKSHGTEGEVIMNFYGLAPEDMNVEEPVYIYFDGLPVPFFIENIAPRGGKYIVRLTGLKSLADADEIAGADVYAEIDAEDCEEGDFSFLEGWTLEDGDGRLLGEICGFLDIPENPCIEVKTADNEVIVPLHEDLIAQIDEENGVLRMNVPDGLFD